LHSKIYVENVLIAVCINGTVGNFFLIFFSRLMLTTCIQESERESPKSWTPIMEMQYRGGTYRGRCQGGLPEGKVSIEYMLKYLDLGWCVFPVSTGWKIYATGV